MTRRWTTFFAAAVLAASLACSGSTETEKERRSSEFEALLEQAEQEDADAQYQLGFMYATGDGVPQDDAKAVRWYRLAADQGRSDAQYNLGYMYSNGEGVPQDDVEAVR